MKAVPGMFRWDALERNLKTVTPLDHEPTREEQRMLLNILDPHGWEETVSARGLAGLKLSALGEWDMGWLFVCRLGGRLQFADVEDRGTHLTAALGLLRPRQMLMDDTDICGHTPETVALIVPGMVATYRKWQGSVLYVGRADRADRVIIWVGLHDRLAQVAAGQDRMAELHRAAERERREEREAQREAQRAAGPTPEELARSLAQQRLLSEEFARSAAGQNTAVSGAALPSPASGGRGRTSVCDDVRDLVSQAPGGLTAAEITTKSGYSQSRVYDCLNGHLDSGVITKVGKQYVTTPKIEEEN